MYPQSSAPLCTPTRRTQTCKIDKDCQSNQCLGGVCAFGPTCNNGIKDIDETDIDCGGIDTGCLPCCWSECADAPGALPANTSGGLLSPAPFSNHRPGLPDGPRLPVGSVR